jgi:hypothetical protein
LKDLPELPKYKLDSNKQIVIDELIEDWDNLINFYWGNSIYYFEIPRKRPNERSECDWSNHQEFNLEGCDTQGMKNNIYYYLKQNK